MRQQNIQRYTGRFCLILILTVLISAAIALFDTTAMTARAAENDVEVQSETVTLTAQEIPKECTFETGFTFNAYMSYTETDKPVPSLRVDWGYPTNAQSWAFYCIPGNIYAGQTGTVGQTFFEQFLTSEYRVYDPAGLDNADKPYYLTNILERCKDPTELYSNNNRSDDWYAYYRLKWYNEGVTFIAKAIINFGGGSATYISSPYFLTAGVPEKEYHTFDGWYLDTTFTTLYDGQAVTEDITLYAKFTPIVYSLTLDVNGGTLEDGTLEVRAVTALDEVTLPVPERVGYTFLGWFKGATQIQSPLQVTNNLSLTARWEINVYTVTFKVDGKVFDTLEVTHGTVLYSLMQTESLAGYKVLDEDGNKLSVAALKAAAVEGDTEIELTEKTKQEIYAEWISANMWAAWLLIGIAGASLIVAIVSSAVAKSRR